MPSDVKKPLTYYAARRERDICRTRAMTAAAAIGTISHEVGWTILTNGTFSMIDIVTHVLSQTGPADVFVTTWVPGNQELADLYTLIGKGDITSFRIVVDDGFSAARPNGAELLVDLFGQGHVFETGNHAKIACIQNADWNYCVRGSLNLNGNARCENVDGDDSAELCDMIISSYLEIAKAVGPGIGHARTDVGKAFRAEMFASAQKSSKGRRMSAKAAARIAGVRL